VFLLLYCNKLKLILDEFLRIKCFSCANFSSFELKDSIEASFNKKSINNNLYCCMLSDTIHAVQLNQHHPCHPYNLV